MCGTIGCDIAKETVFLHDDDANAVVDVEQRRIGWVVRRAACIAAHGAQRLRPVEIDARRDGHADACKARVVTEPAHFNGLCVKAEPGLTAKLGCRHTQCLVERV